MPIVFRNDEENYIGKAQLRFLKASSNKQMKSGGAIYLPQGDGFFTDAINFISEHKDTIKNVADTVGTVAKTGIDIAKGVKELNNIRALTQRAKEQILQKGSGFRVIND